MIWRKDREKKKDGHWNKMYDKLKKFHLENDHFVVPVKNKVLRLWVQNLRVWNKTITDEQRKN